ncbi:MAG TPA: hybrid sensor histidine kinase/response regulator [Isosphaeraceae bacterium]|jgi:two-component system sensor histidine kinase and response regulator WspE|nr:hybrid sensor histidine kinase/response regulator [Isosphaeraceae bacterium]
MNGGDFSMMDLFREEARAHVATLNQGLIELENDPVTPQKIEPLMRAAHSIKGAARIVSIEAAVQLAHVMEDVFVAAQEARIRIRPADIDVLLRGADVLAGLGEVDESGVFAWSAKHAAEIGELQTSFRLMAQGQPAPAAKTTVPPPAEPPSRPAPSPVARPEIFIPREPFVLGDDSSIMDLFREEIRAGALVLNDGLAVLENGGCDAELADGLAQAARSITGAARIVRVEPVVRLGQALEQAFVAGREDCNRLAGETLIPVAGATAHLAEVLRLKDDALPFWLTEHSAELDALCDSLKRLIDPQPAPSAQPDAPPAAVVAVAAARLLPDDGAQAAVAVVPAQEEKPAPATSEAVVRVSAQSLNRLMGLAGESLVQARWLDPFSSALLKLQKQHDRLASVLDRLAQSAASQQHDHVETLVAEARGVSALCRDVVAERRREFQDHAAHAEDLNTRLYREVIVSRMRPFADGAHAFPRLVRDMARQLGKNVRLEIEGQSTEVDRDILEKLEAPLTHLLRNALDHGLESPERRAAAGKSVNGSIRIEARHRAGMLAITVADDGGGIDLTQLRRKVVERRLTTADMVQTMTEPELLEFLFLPGFSTAGALTEYSGRGVGLDVVQTMVRKVGGSVRISTQLGRGTSFHLQLPITLSVLRAVLVDIAGEPYAFPHNRIDRLLRVPASEIRSLEHRQFISVDGQNVGLVLATQLLDLPAKRAEAGELTALLLSDATGQYGLIVEAIRGEQDLVVRPLDTRLGKVPNISAAAILDDGSPVLIADVEDLIRSMDQFIQGNKLRGYNREGPASRARKRVLVVDDSITVREVERQLLRNHGYDVAVAVDGKEGWNTVRAEPFDLVITDVDMPRMNGLDLVKAIRNDAALRSLPVIIVSYKEREEDRQRGLEVGANYYLTKSSFHDHTFLQAVTDLVGED